MLPAGLMWSVVTESPNSAIMRAPCTPGTSACRLHVEAVEERRLGDVGALRPVVDLPG
jgi:hypothetical protein